MIFFNFLSISSYSQILGENLVFISVIFYYFRNKHTQYIQGKRNVVLTFNTKIHILQTSLKNYGNF